MGLSLSVLVAVFLILPGVAFVTRLNRITRTSGVESLLEQQLSAGIALAALSAMVLHLLWMGASYLTWLAIGTPYPNPHAAIVLLAGNVEKFPSAVDAVASHPLAVGVYFVTLAFFSSLSGAQCNKLLPKKVEANWTDLLSPRKTASRFQDISQIWLTIDINTCGVAYLFAGMLIEFNQNKDGTLTRVVLEHVRKRRIGLDGEDEEWRPVAGEFCVLLLPAAASVNVDYVYSTSLDREINVRDADETAFWSEQFNVSEADLIGAVSAVGPKLGQVQAHLEALTH